jgi:tetratricopeptide (TPR) repeat protein
MNHSSEGRLELLTKEFDAIWGRLIERLKEEARILAAENRKAPAQATELLALPQRSRRQRLQAEPRFQSRALVVELISRARLELERRDRPERALPALETALRILRRLRARFATPGSRRGSGLSELGAEALCELGETWRRLGSAASAERCFGQAARGLHDSPDPTARALYCGRLARLRVDQGRGDEAVALFGRAAQLWWQVGDPEQSAAARIEQGLALLRVGDVEEATEQVETALAAFAGTTQGAVQ